MNKDGVAQSSKYMFRILSLLMLRSEISIHILPKKKTKVYTFIWNRRTEKLIETEVNKYMNFYNIVYIFLSTII